MNYNEIRVEFRLRKQKLHRPDVSHKVQYVALVEREWLKKFLNWLEEDGQEVPGRIPNHLLCVDDKFDVTKRYPYDFGIIESDIYDQLIHYFKGGPKIVRPYVLQPGTDKPVLILSPVVLEIHFGDRIFHKVVHQNWIIGSIKHQLLQTFNLPESDFRFEQDGKGVSDKEAIASLKSTTLFLVLKDHDKRFRKRFQRFKRVELRCLVSKTPEMSHVISCVLCLSRIPVTIIERNSDYPCSRVLCRIMEEVVKQGNEHVSCDDLISIFQARTDWDGINYREPWAFLKLLFGTLNAECSKSRNESPLVASFAGSLNASYECTYCHAFDDRKLRFYGIDLPVPQGLEGPVHLFDCIAAYSIPLRMGEAGRMKCQHCKRNGRPYRVLAIDSVNKILTLHFSRWTKPGAFASYIDTEIEYPNELDVSCFSSQITPQQKYSLIGVVFRAGHHDNPNYTCACFDQQTKQWFYFDGINVLSIDPDGVHDKNALLLFYICDS